MVLGQTGSVCILLRNDVVSVYFRKEKLVMKYSDPRQTLINATISVISKEGLDKASTKLIGKAAAMNEAYIYRSFENKEDMFSKAFDFLDEELLRKTMGLVEVMYIQGLDFETRCKTYFFGLWEFLLEDRDQCLTYIRYFYSPYFTKFSAAAHQKRFAPLVGKIRPAFREEADVWMILNHILNVMFDFAVKVHNDQMPKEDDYTEHVFRVIYASVKQYFKDGAPA